MVHSRLKWGTRGRSNLELAFERLPRAYYNRVLEGHELRACKTIDRHRRSAPASVALPALQCQHGIRYIHVHRLRRMRGCMSAEHYQAGWAERALQSVSTCVVEPPQDLLVSARARGKLRYEKLLREAAKTITGECENLLLESVASAD